MTNNTMAKILAVLAAFAIVFVGLCGINLVNATDQVSNLNANVAVASTCEIALNTTLANFGAVNPGASTDFGSGGTGWANTVVGDYNNGNVKTYIWVYAGNWALGSNANAMLQSQTAWSATASGAFSSGTTMTQSSVNTVVAVNAGSDADLALAVSIPNGESAGSYNQIITFTNVC